MTWAGREIGPFFYRLASTGRRQPPCCIAPVAL